VAFGHLVQEISGFAGDPSATTDFAFERDLLAEATGSVEAIVAKMTADLQQSNPTVAGGDEKNVYKVGLNATRLLYVLGDILVAWLLLRSAAIALRALDTDLPAAERSFYEGKVAAARFFARNVLPVVVAEGRIAGAVDDSVMGLDEAAF
jgi:hypothetical protein